MYTSSTKFPYARCYYFKTLAEANEFKEHWHGRGVLRTHKDGETTGYITLL